MVRAGCMREVPHARARVVPAAAPVSPARDELRCLVLAVLQVFEYLSTDLKKWMDKSGKGPAYPLPLVTVKVRSKHAPT